MGVRELDVELLCALDDGQASASADAVGDFGGVDAVLDKEHGELLDVVDEDLAEAVWQEVAGGLVRAVSDAGHDALAREAATDAVVNATGLAPAALEASIAVALVAGELERALLDDLNLVKNLWHLEMMMGRGALARGWNGARVCSTREPCECQGASAAHPPFDTPADAATATAGSKQRVRDPAVVRMDGWARPGDRCSMATQLTFDTWTSVMLARTPVRGLVLIRGEIE